MCSLLSYCQDLPPAWQNRQYHYLARLLLINDPDELLPDERQVLETRQLWLWAQLQQVMQYQYHIPPDYTPFITAQLLAGLLVPDCCRRALRQAISLEQALGPRVR